MSLGPSNLSFAQQGTVDWVALSQTSFTASLAVLGRLAGAGLEPLTVAMSQAICTMFSISVVGEQRLKEAMATCKAFNSYGDAVWFGIGVRHILRTLVQSTQGASCVALAACLTEGFSPQYSALVLYEMAKLMKGPPDLTPSFSQWLRYVETCSGVLAGTTFGKQIDQLSRLSGYATPLCSLDSPHNRAVQAKELAEFLCIIGQIQSGELHNVEVLSGPVSSWAVAFCDSFAGIKIVLYSQEGTVLFQNYDTSTSTPQIVFQNATATNRNRCLTLKGRTFSLNSGEFVEKWHLPKGETTNSSILLSSRVGWATIIHDCYSLEASRIFDVDAQDGCSKSFGDLLAACALVYHDTVDIQHYKSYFSAQDIIDRFCAIFNELGHLRHGAKTRITAIEDAFGRPDHVSTYLRTDHEQPWKTSHNKIEDWISRSQCMRKGTIADCNPIRNPTEWHPPINLSSTIQSDQLPATATIKASTRLGKQIAQSRDRKEAIWQLHQEAMKEILKQCRCGHHPFRCSTVTMLYTVIVTANLFANTIIDEEDELRLSRLGLRALHEEVFDRSFPRDSLESVRGCLLTGMAVSRHIHTVDFTALFESYLHLFSGYSSSLSFSAKTRPKISAMSSGGFYCYVDYLREPFQSEIQCSRIHIGRGSIQVDGRNYAWVHDQDSERLPMLEAGPKKVGQPFVKALVEENVTLRFWYEQWDGSAPKNKQSVNPMECLAKGWSGTGGAWPSLNMRVSHPPTMYTNGLDRVIETDDPYTTTATPSVTTTTPLTASGPKVGKKARNCGRCRNPGHTARTCQKQRTSV